MKTLKRPSRKSLTLIPILLLCYILHAKQNEEIFQAPEPANIKKLEESIAEHTVGMSFMRDGYSVTFGYIKDKAVFTLDIRQDLLQACEHVNKKIFNCQENNCYYCFGDCVGSRDAFKEKEQQILTKPTAKQRKEWKKEWFDPSYHLEMPLRADTAKAIATITLDKLINILKNEKVVFYTGAGISFGAVPTMPELTAKLAAAGLQLDQPFKSWGAAMLANPQQTANAMTSFYQQLLYGTPTKAHYALKNIAIALKTQVFTENLDFLHQRSGINPIGPTGGVDAIKIFKKKYNFSKVDAVVCLGLSHDDRGLLSHFKKVNPKGKIISIDLNRPDYLADGDYLLKADLQKILPKIEEMIEKN